ncbi:MAG: hypothetical protein L3J20_05195 [Flavobacteriaceae bacterium]|nr:hypothetical protein [Flavobacteriaceae bacterium]
MRNLIIVILFFIVLSTHSQESKKSTLEFHFGRAKHGTGDIDGFLYGVQYQQAFGKKIYWVGGFEGTFHDAPNGDSLFFEYEGETFDSTIRFVTAGMQLVAGIKYNFLENKNHTFGIYALPLLRYQATSINDIIDTLYPIITDVPVPVRIIINEEPSRTLSFGGALRFNYNYTFNKGLYLGVLAGFQTDTNGDTMLNAGLTFGKRFNF